MQSLITGGAGFIGSHLADNLIARGDAVRVFDNLEPQVHGGAGDWPTYLDPQVERIRGDVRDLDGLAEALRGVEVVYHLAAATGVGQSMYQIAKYFGVNVQGTANLLDALANGEHGVRRLVLASSRAVYGEGAYACDACGIVHPSVRTPSALDRAEWDPPCPHCGRDVQPTPTPESLTPDPGSMYGITKLCQEQMCARFGEAYGLPVVILRLFNVYGPRQSMSNPYTGIVPAFANRVTRGLPPEVFEDGLMTRDFVHVSDAARALSRAGDDGGPDRGVYNIGSGQAMTVLELAQSICRIMASDLRPRVSGRFRLGDIRHCTALVARATDELSFRPKAASGSWLACVAGVPAGRKPALTAMARTELEQRGLMSARPGITRRMADGNRRNSR